MTNLRPLPSILLGRYCHYKGLEYEVNEIVHERRGISADTALRLARFFGTDVQSWMNLRSHYDLQCAEDAAGRMIQKITPRLALAA